MHCGNTLLYVTFVLHVECYGEKEMQAKKKEKENSQGTEGFLHQYKVPLVSQNRSQPLGKS